MEFILVLLFGFGGIFLTICAIAILLRLLKFTVISVAKIIYLSLTLLAIAFLSLLVSAFVFEPLYYEVFWQSSTNSDSISGFLTFGFVISLIVMVLGRSLPFKIYGILSVATNVGMVSAIALLMAENNSYAVSNSKFASSSTVDSFTIFTIYLVTLNLLTFFLYGYDKFRAWIFPKSVTIGGITSNAPLNHWSQKLARWFEKFAPWIKPPRVPEWILHWHSIFGGSIGAFFGQRFFRHKTKSQKFRPVFLRTIVIQIILLTVISVANAGSY